MTRPLVVLALGVVCASFAAIFIRLADAPPLVIATYRLCLASLVLMPFVWHRASREIRCVSSHDILLALLSGCFLALHFGLWISSLDYTSVVTSVVLVTADPIFVAIASYLLLGEKLTRQAIMGIAVCMAGAGLIAYANWTLGSGSFFGAGLALAAAVAVAGYVLVGRKLRQGMGILSYILLVYTSAAISLLLTTLALGYSLVGYSGRTYFMMVLLALVPQLLGHTSLNWSLRYVPATLATIAFLGEPVGSTIWAYIILGETPAFLELAGGVLVLGGIFIAFQRFRSRGKVVKQTAPAARE